MENGRARISRILENLGKRGRVKCSRISITIINSHEHRAELFSEKGEVEITSRTVNELDDDELAFVLSHEIAHIEHGDTQRLRGHMDERVDETLDASRGLSNEMREAGSGFIKRSLAQAALIALGSAYGYVSTRAKSREHEHEADERAIELVQDAGYDPKGGARAIRKMTGGSYSTGSFVHDVLNGVRSTHPDPNERINNLEQLADRYARKWF